MVGELLSAATSWKTFLIILLVFGFAPGALLRLIVLAFRRDDLRRSELLAELHAVPRLERPFWVFEQLEVALSEGIWPRVPCSGDQDGYYHDCWEANGSFHYTGEGQQGDQSLARGNLAVLNHVNNGRALRIFHGSSGVIQYVGEFVVDAQHPYSWSLAPSTMSGPLRQVIRFHLRPVGG